MPPDDTDPTDSGDSDDDKEGCFEDMFAALSKQWLNVHLTHHVSLAATSSFWRLSLKYFHKMLEMKKDEGIERKIPQYLQVRKNVYKNLCPDVKMRFAFLNKTDNSIVYVNAEETPLSQYQRDPKYQKLYEEAHIEVIIYFIIFSKHISQITYIYCLLFFPYIARFLFARTLFTIKLDGTLSCRNYDLPI